MDEIGQGNHGVGVRRCAVLRLRCPSGQLDARAFWPAAATTPRALIVAFGRPDDPGALTAAGAVLLTCDPRTEADSAAVLEWAAAHAAELGADSREICVVDLRRSPE